jgi:hypothetical protein
MQHGSSTTHQSSITQLCIRVVRVPLLPSFAADMTSSIDPATGRGTDFLPITVTPDVGIGNPFMGGGGPRNLQLALKLIF